MGKKQYILILLLLLHNKYIKSLSSTRIQSYFPKLFPIIFCNKPNRIMKNHSPKA